MKSLWHGDARASLLSRLERLSTHARAHWGRMSALQMLAHVNDTFRMAFGELPTMRRHGRFLWLLRTPPINVLAACFLPFTRNLPTAPELISRVPDDWDTEMQRLRAHLTSFDHGADLELHAEHPFFGKLPSWAWGVLGYRHLVHHLRQFGV